MKKRRKSPHYQPPVHYLVKAGMTRKQALQTLKSGLSFGLAEPKVEGAKTNFDPTQTPALTVPAAYAEGLKDALRLVLESRRYG